MEQELKVHCIWCDEATEPTADDVRGHLLKCQKHPIYTALKALRDIEKGPVFTIEQASMEKPTRLSIAERTAEYSQRLSREALRKIEHDCGPTVYDLRQLL